VFSPTDFDPIVSCIPPSWFACSCSEAGQDIDSFVVLTDLAPTFLEAAGQPVLPEMTGRSLLPLLAGAPPRDRDHVFLERERYAQMPCVKRKRRSRASPSANVLQRNSTPCAATA
jgi:arylsulfatase A-like enzyme